MEQEEDEDDEEESEYESDGETSNMPQHIIPEKPNLSKPKKRMKIPKFINPLKQPAVKTKGRKRRPQDVFDLQTGTQKKQKMVLDIANKNEDAPSFIIEPTGNVEGFGLIFPAKKDDEEKEEPREFISKEELTKNKMSNYSKFLILKITYYKI